VVVEPITAHEIPQAAPRPQRPQPVPPWERLEEQIAWYNRRSASAKQRYHVLKLITIVTAAAIPVIAAVGGAEPWVTGLLGAVIVTIEGFQQLFQLHANWTTYRSTCEALKHEKHLWFAGAGPYAQSVDPDRLLAERVEGLVSQEHAAWTSTQQVVDGGEPGAAR